MHEEQSGRFKVGVHVGNFPLDGLKITDFFAELRSFQRIFGGLVHCRKTNTEGQGTDADASAGKFADRAAKTVVLFTHQSAGGNAAVLKQYFVGG
jgi:hypothetical protein